MAGRTPCVAGNWKMNLRLAEAVALATGVRLAAEGVRGIDVGVFPPFPFLPAVHAALDGSRVILGAQSLHSDASGARTGDVAGEQLADVGCTCVLVGHSERRQEYEDDAAVASRAVAALRAGLEPVVCVGERLAERKADETIAVITRQLGAVLDVLPDPTPVFCVAYEPVWAIGTGEVATVEQAGAAHRVLREQLTKRCGADVATRTRILYGGSVKPENAGELCAHPDIDGALVGGASLDAGAFAGILQAAVPVGAGGQ